MYLDISGFLTMGNLTYYGRGKADLNKLLPRDHGEFLHNASRDNIVLCKCFGWIKRNAFIATDNASALNFRVIVIYQAY